MCLNESNVAEDFIHFSQNVFLSLELHSQKEYAFDPTRGSVACNPTTFHMTWC